MVERNIMSQILRVGVAVVALAATLFATAPSLAQQQPYAGLEFRPLKALSTSRPPTRKRAAA